MMSAPHPLVPYEERRSYSTKNIPCDKLYCECGHNNQAKILGIHSNGQHNMKFGHSTGIHAPQPSSLIQHAVGAMENLPRLPGLVLVSKIHRTVEDESLTCPRPIMQPCVGHNNATKMTEVCDSLFENLSSNNGACEAIIPASDTTKLNRRKNTNANMGKVRSSA